MRSIATHPLLSGAGALVFVAGAVVVGNQLNSTLAEEYTKVDYAVPEAPSLTAVSGETVYHIDPTQSEASYKIGEKIFGQGASTAEGSTSAIAGEIAIDHEDPTSTRVGEIVIDIEQLRSDSNLRDARIRKDFLESGQYKLARFKTTAIDGLPDNLTNGKVYDISLTGDLSIKSATHETTWTGTASIEGDELIISASTDVLLTDFGMEPISLVGLLSTDNELTLSIDVRAVDVKSDKLQRGKPDDVATADKAGGPSYAKDVAPILQASCASCHEVGGIGASVLTLSTADDAAQYADGIALATRTLYMPPWPASDVGIPLSHDWSLTQDQIDILQQWADSGAQLDVPAKTALTADAPDPRYEIDADTKLTMTEPYVGDGTKSNDYRCIIFDPGFTEPTYVTGYSFAPGETEVVHHGLTYRVDAADREATLARSGVDGRTGWDCGLGGGMGPGTGRSKGRGALFAGWVPGQRPVKFGENQGFLFLPGELIVSQIHYHYSDKILADQSTLLLQTAPDSPEMRELHVNNPTGPVELPCPADRSTNPLCDRDAAIVALNAEYGPMSGGLANALRSMCASGLVADPVTGNGSTTCDYGIREDGQIVDLLGHMHQLGKAYRMTLNPDTPNAKILLDIPTWNFDWQLNFQPVEEVHVKRGDTIRVECSWDRSLKYDPNPRYIVFAEGTEDEMCFSTYTLLPDKK